MWRIVGATTGLTWITAGYGWFTIIAPILIAAPGYFGGDLSFGALMMAVGAFIQVQQSLRWFIDNFSTIADWRATLLRVAGFRETVMNMDRSEQLRLTLSSSRYPATRSPLRTWRSLRLPAAPCLASSTYRSRWGTACSSSASPEPARLSCSGRSQACGPGVRAASHCRRRTVLCSYRDSLMYRWEHCVQRVAYPSPETAFKDEELAAVLQSAGLDRLSSSLDQIARWDKELSR